MLTLQSHIFNKLISLKGLASLGNRTILLSFLNDMSYRENVFNDALFSCS